MDIPTLMFRSSIVDVAKVRELDDQDVSRWDEFVKDCKEATFFHLAGWKNVVERAFGHRCYFLYAESAGKIRGVLPLGHIRSRLFGHVLISSPFGVYGGIVAEDLETYNMLDDAACGLARRLNVDYLELRNRRKTRSDRPSMDLYVTFRKCIDPNPEKNLLEIPRKQRAMVRKGVNAGLQSAIDHDVDRLYAVYAESVRNLGTPVFSKKYFRILKEVFDRDCEVLTVTKDGKPVSSVMSFYFRDEVLPYYGGGIQGARPLAANDFMYWEVMRRACEKGIRIFDYGRSKVGTGSYHFKKNWGFEPEILDYEYVLVNARNIPNVNPMNPKYRLLINIWKQMPLALARSIGPMIAKGLG